MANDNVSINCGCGGVFTHYVCKKNIVATTVEYTNNGVSIFLTGVINKIVGGGTGLPIRANWWST